MITEEQNKEDKFKSKELYKKLHTRVHNAKTLDFLMSVFVNYMEEHENYKELLKPLEDKFDKFLQDNGSLERHGKLDLLLIVKEGLTFLATHPSFSASEFVQAGANLTTKEMKQFGKELVKTIKRPSTREALTPYIATVGYRILKYINAKDEDFRKGVEEKLLQMRDIVGAEMIRVVSSRKQDPGEKALLILQRLEASGITLNENGDVVEDVNNLIQKEKDARAKSQGSSKDTGTSNLSKAPENLN